MIFWRDATPDVMAELGAQLYSDAALLALVPEAGIDRAELVKLVAMTFTVSDRTAIKYVDDARSTYRHVINGKPVRCALLVSRERPRRGVYPMSPRGREVVWITRAVLPSAQAS
jgi:hypothetical protein